MHLERKNIMIIMVHFSFATLSLDNNAVQFRITLKIIKVMMGK